MGKDTCTEERFLKDVTNHQMTVLRDDGVYRHLQFRKPGTICYGFDLITFPGKLIITGDCGTYAFQRLHDMFEFFGDGKSEGNLSINTGYWGEKLISICRNGGYKVFSEERFREAVNEFLNEHWEYESDDEREVVAEEVQDQVLDYIDGNGDEAIRQAFEFKSKHGHEFTDFFEYSFDAPSWHYVWNLYAIAWGIRSYRTQQQAAA